MTGISCKCESRKIICSSLVSKITRFHQAKFERKFSLWLNRPLQQTKKTHSRGAMIARMRLFEGQATKKKPEKRRDGTAVGLCTERALQCSTVFPLCVCMSHIRPGTWRAEAKTVCWWASLSGEAAVLLDPCVEGESSPKTSLVYCSSFGENSHIPKKNRLQLEYTLVWTRRLCCSVLANSLRMLSATSSFELFEFEHTLHFCTMCAILSVCDTIAHCSRPLLFSLL